MRGEIFKAGRRWPQTVATQSDGGWALRQCIFTHMHIHTHARHCVFVTARPSLCMCLGWFVAPTYRMNFPKHYVREYKTNETTTEFFSLKSRAMMSSQVSSPWPCTRQASSTPQARLKTAECVDVIFTHGTLKRNNPHCEVKGHAY